MSNFTKEPITCPSRINQSGPWEHGELLDEWVPGDIRWSRDGRKWPENFEKPRTCSFCGSVNFNDLLALLQHGWEIDWAKSYKLYLNPPGYRAYSHKVVYELSQGLPREAKLEFENPIPPVKGYMWHCSSEQIIKLRGN